MTPEEKREMDIDAELAEIDGRYKRQQKTIQVLAIVCIALAIILCVFSVHVAKRGLVAQNASS